MHLDALGCRFERQCTEYGLLLRSPRVVQQAVVPQRKHGRLYMCIIILSSGTNSRSPISARQVRQKTRIPSYWCSGLPGPLREHEDAAKAQIRWWRNSGGAAFTHTGRSDTRMNYSSIGGCTKRFALTAVLSAMIALFWLVIEPAGAVSLFHPIPRRVHERCTRK